MAEWSDGPAMSYRHQRPINLWVRQVGESEWRWQVRDQRGVVYAGVEAGPGPARDAADRAARRCLDG